MEKHIPYIIGIGLFQKKAALYIKSLKRKHQEGLLVSHSRPQAVLMSLGRYEQLRHLEDEKKQEMTEVIQIVSAGDEEFAQGKTVKARSLRKLMTL